MNYYQLSQLLQNELLPKLTSNRGLSVFANHRAKFEGWLKAELIDCLQRNELHPRPEIDHIDVTFDHWAIELKTINTSYRYPDCRHLLNRTRPITMNIDGVISDIQKLRRRRIKHAAVIFVVFPLRSGNNKWEVHLRRILRCGIVLRPTEFCFHNDVPATLYCGRVK
jgi:hypothetical protein